MLSRLRTHVRHNVVAYLALFFALTGVAYAAGPLKSGDPAGGDLTGTYPNPTIASGAVTTGKLHDGAVTTGKFDSGAKAPDADKLDGLNSTAFGSGAMMGRAVGQIVLPDQAWLAPSGNSEPSHNGADAAAQLSPNSDIVARDLSVRGTANTSNGDYAMSVTLVTGPGFFGSPTSLTCTSGGDVVFSCNSGTATATIPAGTPVALEYELLGNSDTTVSDLQFGWRATTP